MTSGNQMTPDDWFEFFLAITVTAALLFLLAQGRWF